MPEADDRVAAIAGSFDAAYRAAVTGADAYRGVRAALRRDGPTLRLGNRFVPLAGFREIAFFAVGSAASSLALATAAALGERLTQGFAVGPEALPPQVPFRSTAVPLRRSPRDGGASVAATALELAGELTESDLLITLLSAGSLFALAEAPEGLGAAAWGELLGEIRNRGATAAELARVVRVVGAGVVGGALAAATPATILTLVVARGDGAALVGGGPTWPVTRTEREEVRALVTRLDLRDAWPASLARRLDPGLATRPNPPRPVIVAEPPDALREASAVLAGRR
ncbi:MAG: DUF4147 domain-containing protein, partial [Thermoplasmata archaeon]|nr:DUF4147 domain-containing protein [Thermoplasmata archaeon]